MERLFSILTFVVVLMILIAGSGVFLSSKIVVTNAKDEAAQAAIKGVAQTLTYQIRLQEQTLDKMAQDAEVITAINAGNPAVLATTAAKLEKYFPNARKIRLLPVGTIEPDQVNVPRMGFGDIEMVKATFQDSPPPAIQGDPGPDRHLAITRKIIQNNQVIGVILASLNFDFIDKSLKDGVADDAYMEIRQGKLNLSNVGDKNDVEEDDLNKINVAGTSLDIYYPDPNGGNMGNGLVVFAFIVIPVLFALATLFICYRQFSTTLAQDLDWVLQAFKDVLVNRPKGSYPVSLNGMNSLIASMVRFNREVELQGEGAIKTPGDDFELEGYLGDTGSEMPKAPVYNPQASAKPIASSAYEVSDVPATMEAPQVSEVDKQPEIIQSPQPAQPKSDINSAIFRAYDIRGIVDQSLTKEIVYDIGRAIASEAKESGAHTVVVARDGRVSSPSLAEALANGIISTGCNVLDIGMVPSPVLYFVVQHTDGRSGVMITGSHNPPEYNGLKMMIKGETLSGDHIQQIKQRIDAQAFSTGSGSIEENSMFESEYIGTLCEDIQVTRAMKVVIDCGNGVTGELAPVLFKNLGCEVIELFCEVDGNFPNHHPDPSKPENLGALINAVVEHKADIGIAFDGDGDRLGVVDSNGKIIWPDRQMMLYAKDVLAGKPGSEIIYDVKCSRHLPTQIVKYGGRPLMWKTGHSFMKAKLKETGAKLAGEMSGHIFFNDRWFGFDDALYSAARLLQILSEDRRPSAEVFADFPDSVNTPELNVTMAEGENFKFIEQMFASAKFPGGKITDIDGLRIDFSDGWGLVRASNTTPSLVLRFEADNRAAMEKIQNQFRDLMRSIKPDIKLPF